MTDNEIIEALECCGDKNCKYCPNFSEDIECSEKLIKLSLDLINRQKAENKKLMDMVGQNEGVLPEYEKFLKSEAVREFAEILKNKSELLAPSVYAEPFRAVSVEEIDRLAKRK